MPTLETYRKRAKLLGRWHREGNYSVGGRVRQLERYRSLTDREVLALKFTLALAQEIIAIEAGHQSWAELKFASAKTPKHPREKIGRPLLKKAIPILFVRDVTASATFPGETGFCCRFPSRLASILRGSFARWGLPAPPLRGAPIFRRSRRSGEGIDFGFHRSSKCAGAI
jgi:hypothetical protein